MIESGTIGNQNLIHAIESGVNDASKDHGLADKGEWIYHPTVEATIQNKRVRETRQLSAEDDEKKTADVLEKTPD